MGWAARRNPRTAPQMQRQLRVEQNIRYVLSLFPDRTMYEQWLTARKVDDVHRAHLEQFLPARLQQQGTV